MGRKVKLLDGPGHGESVSVEQDKGMVGFPLDKDLNAQKGPGAPFAFAIYRLDNSGSEPVYRFVSAQRKNGDEDFEVEFVDGPMKGVHPFAQAIQLHDNVLRVPLDADHRVMKQGANVGAIAEYKRKRIDGIWKMALVGIAEGQDETEPVADVIAERKLTQELQVFTTAQLVNELLSRQTFVGLILMYPGELTGKWRLEKGAGLVMRIGPQLDEKNAKMLLRSALESLEN